MKLLQELFKVGGMLMIKQIVGFENYTIDENGKVVNIKRNQVKKPTSNNAGKGYLYVDLYNNGKKQREYIHRLVAKTFISNIKNKPYVNHIDGNPHNNNVNNLEWCTPLENVEHASKILDVMHGYKIANERREKPVKQIECSTGNVIQTFKSIREASRQTNIRSEYITQICKGKLKPVFGYSWCYAESEE